jgi:hypothetical protein
MGALATSLAILAFSPTGLWSGGSDLAPQVSLSVRDGVVTSAAAWTSVYQCELGGNVGPAEVRVRPLARISSTGRVRFAAGRKSRRLHADLRFKGGLITGKIRITGQIGGPCASPSVSVQLNRN